MKQYAVRVGDSSGGIHITDFFSEDKLQNAIDNDEVITGDFRGKVTVDTPEQVMDLILKMILGQAPSGISQSDMVEKLSSLQIDGRTRHFRPGALIWGEVRTKES